MRTGRSTLAVLALLSAPLAAQEEAPAFDASPLLPSGHWAVRAAWRAEALGLAPGFMPAQRGAPRAAVAAALEQAAERAGDGSPYAALVAGWGVRFRDEFPEYRRTAGAAATRLGGEAAIGYARWTGRLAPATGLFFERADPVRLDDRSGPVLRGAAGIAVGRRAALHGVAGAGAGRGGVLRWEAAVGAGPVSLSAGRAEVGYGPGHTGGIVLSTAEPLGRVEVQTTRPVPLPRLLRLPWSLSAHTFAARMDGGRHPERPWLWGARVALRPHARVTLGINRASIFGGDSARITVERLGGMLIGTLSEDFENQIVSVDGRWRLPTDAVLPATLYLEWGAEDAAGAWRDQPARTGGVSLPALPGIPWASAGVEHTRFAECCGHGVWYTHSTFGGNWARGNALLGHPLGGEGSETALYAGADLPWAPLSLDGTLFVRRRSEETPGIAGGGNLLAPHASGRGTGGALRARLRLGGAELGASVYRDATGVVREARARTEIRYLF